MVVRELHKEQALSRGAGSVDRHKEGHAMKARALLVAFFLLAASVPVGSLRAEAVDIQVVIKKVGSSTQVVKTGPNEVDISGSYEGFTIGPTMTGLVAKVRAVDQSVDKIVLENALIKATQGSVNGEITYWGTLSATDNAPSAPPETTIRWERKADGTLTRGPLANPTAATGDWFEVTGWVKQDNLSDNEIGTLQRKTVICSSMALGCGTIALRKTEDWSSLTGGRDLKVKFTFFLSLTDDRLTSSPVHVQNISTAGDDADPMIGVTEGASGP